MAHVVAEAGERTLVLISEVGEPLSGLSFLRCRLEVAELSMSSCNDESEAHAEAADLTVERPEGEPAA